MIPFKKDENNSRPLSASRTVDDFLQRHNTLRKGSRYSMVLMLDRFVSITALKKCEKQVCN